MNINSSAHYFSHASPLASSPNALSTEGANSHLTSTPLSERPVSALGDASGVNQFNRQSKTDTPAVNGLQDQPSLNNSDDESKQQSSIEKAQEERVLEQEQAEITALSARDREVRAHEQAHAAVGGQYAGAPKYQFERGPDGISYAVGGEVSIDVSRASTPEETIQKMLIVRRAALAPAEPSPQDRRVAAQASLTYAQAVKDLALEKSAEANEKASSTESEGRATEKNESLSAVEQVVDSSSNINALPQGLSPVSNSGLPPSAINSALNRSILATSLTSRAGSLLDQLA